MTTISRQVPFLDLAMVHRELSAEILSSIETSLHSARFVGGPEVDAFESEFAAHVEAPFAVGVASGTDALRLACRALGLEPAD
ncbi:MAG: DegT/DnrJ/EryC1/StrS family aminotransferase, partial [Planctomycetes bacterium]|nr:DegT/DnrJ/EryC1/StrS family aminotransferase [Planctomycetota bacterium]